MNNLYNLGGALQAPPTPNIKVTGQSQPVAATGGENLPQVAVSNTSSSRTASTSSLIEQAVSDLAAFADSHQRSLSFSINKDTGDTIIVVRDSVTEEVVRQIPSEFAVQLAQNLNRMRETLEISVGQGGANPLDYLDSAGNLVDTNV